MLAVSIRAALVVSIVAVPAAAAADRPCAAESQAAADAGGDPSLVYPTEPAAVEHLNAGNRAFRVQQYDKAIDEYTAAGLVTSAPLVLYNLGQTLRAAEQYEKAIRQYELYMSRGNPGPTMRALVECHIATMKAELDAAASTAPPSGPAPDTVATTSEPATTIAPTEEPSAVDRPSRWTGGRKVAVGVAAGGLMAIGAGIFFGVRSNGFEDDATALCPSGVCASAADAGEANDLIDQAESNATYSNLAFGVGAAAAIGAVALWVFGAPDESPAAVSIVPRVTGDSAGVALRWGF
jgi:tetratricopeptide (TPR) repeat protein